MVTSSLKDSISQGIQPIHGENRISRLILDALKNRKSFSKF